jgi:5-methylcytosine-specific restriction protein A
MVTDHRTPHRGDHTLFWDPTNWQPMSKACHDVKTAKEDGGFGMNHSEHERQQDIEAEGQRAALYHQQLFANAGPRVINFVHGHPAYWCPVCHHPHWLDQRWKWNGDRDRPTFGPAQPGARYSFLSFHDVRAKEHYELHRTDKNKRGTTTYATYAEAYAARPNNLWEVRGPITTPAHRHVHCHVFIENGMLRVLGDTPGPLAGRTVQLQPWTCSEDGSRWTQPRHTPQVGE